MVEWRFPFCIQRYEFRPDSGGAGTHRDGLITPDAAQDVYGLSDLLKGCILS